MGHELDELLWDSGPDGSNVSVEEWHRIVQHTFKKLSTFFRRPLDFCSEPIVDGSGFCVEFTSSQPSDDPLQIQIHGTYGVGLPVADDANPCLQGFVYVYSNGRRLVAANERNHVYLHYVRTDAEDEDFSMIGCTGPFEWRSYGWSVDTYGEMEGREHWRDLNK